MSAPDAYSPARGLRFIRLCFIVMAVILFAPLVAAYVLANAGGSAR